MLRIAEDHRQARAPRPRAHIRVAAGIVAGDASFVGGFVQQHAIDAG